MIVFDRRGWEAAALKGGPRGLYGLYGDGDNGGASRMMLAQTAVEPLLGVGIVTAYRKVSPVIFDRS
jgi:hypothetical protein